MVNATLLEEISSHCGQSTSQEEKLNFPEESCCDDSLSALSQDAQITSPETGKIDFETSLYSLHFPQDTSFIQEQSTLSNTDPPSVSHLSFHHKLKVVFHC